MKSLFLSISFTLLLLGMGLAVYPRVFTGDYAKVRIDKLESAPDGRIDISYSGMCTSGHFVKAVAEETGRPVRHFGSISGSIGFGFPRKFIDEDNRWSPTVVPNLEDELLIEEGESYFIKIDTPLVIFDLEPQKGRHNKGMLKLARQTSCPVTIHK